MKTLVYEPDPLRARAYAARLARAGADVTIAASPEAARDMLQTTHYERLALRAGPQALGRDDILGAQRAAQPNCDVVDIERLPGRVAPAPSAQRWRHMADALD